MFKQAHFFYALALGLWITAAAKLISASGNATILSQTDVVTGIKNSTLMRLAGYLELATGAFLCISNRERFKAILATSLFSSFASYKFVYWLSNAKAAECPCLGHVTDRLPFGPHFLSVVLNCFLVIGLVGSVSCLTKRSGEQ